MPRATLENSDHRRRGWRVAGSLWALTLAWAVMSRSPAHSAAAVTGPAPARPGPGAKPPPPAEAGVTSRARFLMGAWLRITIPGPVAEDPFDRVFAEVARLERILSNWDEASELSRLNATAAARPVHCSPDLHDAVRVALWWAAVTGGAFDPTVEPLVLRFGLRGAEGTWENKATRWAVPGEGAPTSGTGDGSGGAGHGEGPVGWRHVILRRMPRSIVFDGQGVGIDLGGIGKGIALDAAARVLRERGIPLAMLDFGGQVLAIGAPAGGAWPVGLAEPGDRLSARAWIGLRDASVATSGRGERAGAAGAGHILDPDRGTPAAFDGLVSVVASDATSADALSTALFVMGPDRGLAWSQTRGVAVIYQWRAPDGTITRRASRAFPDLVAGDDATASATD